MMMRLQDLNNNYDLYDKVVLSISETSRDGVTLKFDLYSDDDPDRNDYRKEFLLLITVDRSQIDVKEGPLFLSEPEYSGQVLEDATSGGGLELGIEWSKYSDDSYEWTKLVINSDFLDVEELTIERK